MKRNHKPVVNMFIFNSIFLQATCGEPDIPTNGSLCSTSSNKKSNGEYPDGTEAIFTCPTRNGTIQCHSFCQGGNWSGIFPFTGINTMYVYGKKSLLQLEY